MATETQNANSVVSSSNLVNSTNVYADDTSWATASSNNSDSVIIVGFPTPSGPPNTGAGLQGFTVKYRVTANANSVSFACYLLENGTRINGGTAIDSWSSTSTTEVTRQVTWDASLLGTSDGSLVECEVYATKSGGSPANRTTGEFQYIDWDVDYSVAAQNISGTGIASAEAFGSAAITTGNVNIVPTGIASSEAFGSPNVGQIQIVAPNALASAEAFGSATLLTAYNIGIAAGIASGETVNGPTIIAGSVDIQPNAISSIEAFGNPTLAQVQAIIPTSITTLEAFGNATLNPGAVSMTLNGIASGEVFGSPTVAAAAYIIEASSISSQETLGNPTLSSAYEINASGIGSQEALGSLTVLQGSAVVTMTGISSQEAFGFAVLSGGITEFYRSLPHFVSSLPYEGSVNDKLKQYLESLGYTGAKSDKMVAMFLSKYGIDVINSGTKRWKEDNYS